ncbi:MAG: CpaF family protein [Myxococcaceae bacterium]
MTMYTESLRAFLKPVLPYLDDDSVSEIMINGPEDIWIERKGRVSKTDARFSEEGLLGAARNMAQFVGRPLSEERPRLDARLPDGSRIHVVLPPIARRGTTISIRKFFKDKLTVDALLKYKSLTTEMARVIEAAIQIKLNMVVSGGTGSGKTTLLNIISSLIPNDERILTIEDSAELQLNQEHLVAFESRPADKYGKGEINMGDLLHSALRLRPDRIVVGEVRGGEAFHLMQAMNTGHGGSLSTTHANTPTDTLRRLESLCLMSPIELPMVAVRAQVASAINLIVCCERLHDGSRKTSAISEVLPLNDKGEYRTQDIFVFTPVCKDEDGHIIGYHAPTGIIPNFIGKARAYGFTDLDDKFFDPATYGVPPPPLYTMGEAVTIKWVNSLKHREKGIPDPDSYKQTWLDFEEKLKVDFRAQQLGKPAALAASKPKAAAALPAPGKPPPSRPPVREKPAPVEDEVGDEDKTPPPSRNPLMHMGPTGTVDGDLEEQMDLAIADAHAAENGEEPSMSGEPKVEVSQDMVSDAERKGTGVRQYGPADKAARPAGGPGPKGPPAGTLPVRRQLRPNDGKVDTSDTTNIKPVPDKFRR